MNATTVMYLAAIAAAIHVLLGALQSNSLNAMLAKFGIPAFPAVAMPWLGLVLGLGGGLVTGLQQGLPWQQSLATAILGMLGGGASALHVESMVGNTHAAVKASGGGGTATDKQTVVPPMTALPIPPVAKRTFIRILAPITLALSLWIVIGGTTQCSWFSSNKPQVVTDLGQVASCVISQMFQGVTDPLKITSACVGATLADVEQIISSIINFYDQPTEAGVAASDQHCGQGKAPYDGLKPCVTSQQLAGFKQLHDQVKSQMAAGAK